jgi:uncharacterized protein (DUF2132 family)
MQEAQPNNPLHGVTLEQLLNALVSFYGWDALGRKIEIRCFTHDPSIASSLKFLRRTPWARARVEALYVEMCHGLARSCNRRSLVLAPKPGSPTEKPRSGARLLLDGRSLKPPTIRFDLLCFP